MPMQKNVTFYFQNNILETTSGNFATDLVKFHAQQIGLERILYSIDYPYVPMEQGAAWLADEVPTFLDADQAVVERLARRLARLDRGGEAGVNLRVAQLAQLVPVAAPERFEDHRVGGLGALEEAEQLEAAALPKHLERLRKRWNWHPC